MNKPPEDIKILLAEDAKTMRRIEVNILNSLGYKNIIEADDGIHAKKLLQKTGDIDLIISDWNMPNMSGYDLLVWSRQKSKKFKKVPFIMATAQADKAQKDKVIKAGGTSVVPKPFTPDELNRKISQALGLEESAAGTGDGGEEMVDGKIKLRVAHLQITDHLLLGMVREKIRSGLLKPDNFVLQTELMGGWNPVIEALEEGEVDAAFILAPIAMDLNSHGSPLKIVLMAHRGGSIMVRNAHNDYKKPYSDFFKNKSCLIPHKLSIHHMLSHIFFKGIGLNASLDKGDEVDVNFEVVAPVSMPAFMGSNHDAAAFIVAEPVGSKAINGGIAKRQFMTTEIWPEHPCCVVAVRQKFIEKHPEAVQEFIDYLVKAGKGMAADTANAVRVGVEFLDPDKSIGLKEGLLKKVITDPAGIRWDSLYPFAADFETIHRYMSKELHIGGELDVDRLLDLRFADKACTARDKITTPPTLLALENIPALLTTEGRKAGAPQISLKKMLFDKGVEQDAASGEQLSKLAADYDALQARYEELRQKESAQAEKIRNYEVTAVKLFKEGVARLKNEDFFEAAGLFNAVLSLEPENMKALNNLAVIYSEMNFPEKARETLERILEIEPDNDLAKENLAIAKM
ncbi:MAG TPA: response regulator [Desulfobacterales bacterium]|nr:response regulator [Desulfobacterales bacterium]